jgi:hypothetical protein
MKLMTFVGATMFLVLTACDPTPPVDTASAIAYLGNRITNDFAFDNVAVSLSPVTDIDPNGDCTFAEGTVNGQSTRFLVEDPVRMCPKGSTYRTCSLTTLASTGGMNATRVVHGFRPGGILHHHDGQPRLHRAVQHTLAPQAIARGSLAAGQQ